MKKVLFITKLSLATFNIAKNIQEVKGIKLLGVVLEKDRPNKKFKRLIKNYRIKTVGILGFKIINRILNLSKSKYKKYDFYGLQCPVYETDDINSANTEEIIKK